jgi:transcriptional regulator with XRE-family HTH domain
MSIGLTQKQVANLLGHVTSSQVSRWERGERLPNLVHAVRLSALYQRLVNDLFFDLFVEERESLMKKADKLNKSMVTTQKASNK